MKIKSINIGEEILARLNELNMSKSEFGRIIGIPQQNVNRILEKSSIDTDKLIKICSALRFNFFSLFFDEDRIAELGRMSISATDHSQAAGRDLHVSPEDAVMAERVKYLEDLLNEKEERISELKERIEDLKSK